MLDTLCPSVAVTDRRCCLDCNQRGVVVKNLSTSRAVDDAAAKYGCSVVAAAVGEINVANRMVELNAVIGGEGNGGVMLPEIHIGRDAIVAATLVLQHFAWYRKGHAGSGSLSELRFKSARATQEAARSRT